MHRGGWHADCSRRAQRNELGAVGGNLHNLLENRSIHLTSAPVGVRYCQIDRTPLPGGRLHSRTPPLAVNTGSFGVPQPQRRARDRLSPQFRDDLGAASPTIDLCLSRGLPKFGKVPWRWPVEASEPAIGFDRNAVHGVDRFTFVWHASVPVIFVKRRMSIRV